MSAKNFKISVEQAVEYTTTWRTVYKSDPSIPLAFTLRHEEMMDIVNEVLPPGTDPKDIAYRFYMGYRQEVVATPKGNEMQTHPALVIVAVTGFVVENGKVINPGTDLYEITKTISADGDDDNSGCFDFSFPCPATCQFDSPLMTGIIP